jgi:hypothetical protein
MTNPQSTEESRFVVVTSKGNYFELSFFDKEKQTDFVDRVSIEMELGTVNLLGAVIVAWQLQGTIPSLPTSERNAKIASLYYGGYSRRAIAEAFHLTTERVAQILSRHARANRLDWPPHNPNLKGMARYDHPRDYRPIPRELL